MPPNPATPVKLKLGLLHASNLPSYLPFKFAILYLVLYNCTMRRAVLTTGAVLARRGCEIVNLCGQWLSTSMPTPSYCIGNSHSGVYFSRPIQCVQTSIFRGGGGLMRYSVFRKSNSSCNTTDAMRRVESRFSFKSSPGVSPQDLNFHRNGTQSPRFARRRYQRLWVVVRIHQPSSKAQSCHCRYFCCQKGQSCINAVGRLLL